MIYSIHLQPGNVGREQRNILQVDLYTLNMQLLYAVTILWIFLQDYTHTHTHTLIDILMILMQEVLHHTIVK